MNLILLFEEDFINDDHVQLSDRRFQHIQNIHNANIGDTLTVGRLNEKIGAGIITAIDNTSVTLQVTTYKLPPTALPLTLILALPRPKMLKRILQTCATMGVKKIILINTYRVEKSFWQSPLLNKEKIQEQLILGLEQAKDTLLPEVIIQAFCRRPLTRNMLKHPCSCRSS